MTRIRTRAGIGALALIGTAIPGRFRRGSISPPPGESAVPADPVAPVEQRFEANASAPDGTPVRVTAIAAPGNQVHVVQRDDDRDPEPRGRLSIAEGGSHPAEQRGRPITWAVVAFISLACVAAGLGIVYAMVWLFVAGLIAAVAGGLAGWAFAIMDDRGTGGPITRSRSTGDLQRRRARGR